MMQVGLFPPSFVTSKMHLRHAAMRCGVAVCCTPLQPRKLLVVFYAAADAGDTGS
jgi:hypothetical protein